MFRERKTSRRDIEMEKEMIHHDKDPRDPVFVLCSPRSGSTLMRVMLAGHSGLFAPPELHLLDHETFSERAQALDKGAFMGLGLVKAIESLKGLNVRKANSLVRQWIEEDHSVVDIYRLLQEWSGERRLVDKTPTYTEHLETLQRAKRWFPNATYIQLVRHPYSVMDSIIRLNEESPLVRDIVFRGEVDSWGAAETVWSKAYRNTEQFLAEIDPARKLTVRYEDLVVDPESVARKICEKLEVPFDEGMLSPYEPGRMTEGIAIGDVNFRKHRSIDPALGEAWRKIRPPRPLDGSTRTLADRYSYEIPV